MRVASLAVGVWKLAHGISGYRSLISSTVARSSACDQPVGLSSDFPDHSAINV